MYRKINDITYNPPSIAGTNSTTTGTTAETILNHVYLPANTYGLYDLVGVQTRLTKTTSGSTFSVRLRIGTSLNTSQTLVGFANSSAVGDQILPFSRRLSIQSLTTDTRVINSSASTLSQDFQAGSNNTINTFSIDWTQNLYIIVTSQTTGSSEVVNCPFIYLDLIEPRV